MTRDEIFKKAAQLMRAQFQELSVNPHNALRGGEAEDIIRRFLNAHIPKRFSVGSGFILDPKGAVSRQTDVVVYDAFNCPVYRASETAAIYPSNNVAMVVEVKSTLDKDELVDAWQKIAAVKQLAKHRADGPGVKAQTVGFVFAFASKTSLGAIADNYRELFNKNGIGHHIDAIFVLDLGFVTLAAQLPNRPGEWAITTIEALPDSAEGTHLAVSASQTDAYTLDAFMRLLLFHLMTFRPIVDHPGFRFDEMPIEHKDQVLSYLTSHTTERDPQKRREKLERYANAVIGQFQAQPPAGWGKNKS
jgi:hypothetical protein